MSEIVSIERDGAERARSAFERCVGAGGIALFPADTVYGLACDPLNARGVARIHQLKGREEGKPSAVMFFSPLAMRELVASLGSRTRDAVAALLPGPLTLVVHNRDHRYPLACRADPERLGVRLIEGPLGGAGCAVFQTSANLSGEEPAREVGMTPGAIREGVDLIVDAGELPGTPSTVIDLVAYEGEGGWRLIREGAIPRDEIDRRLARISR